MGTTDDHSSSGISFKNVGSVLARDMAGRDLIQKSTTTIRTGFAGENQKQKFQSQVDELRDMLRAIQRQITDHPGLSNDEKDELFPEVADPLKALKEAKDEAAAAPVGEDAPTGISNAVEAAFNATTSIVEKLKKYSAIAAATAPLLEKCAPLIDSARHLFGFH